MLHSLVVEHLTTYQDVTDLNLVINVLEIHIGPHGEFWSPLS